MNYSWYRWRLPLRQPLQLGGRRFERREGLYLKIEEGGRCGWGEAAPLPGFSRESLDEIIALVQSDPTLEGVSQLPPSLDFALECARRDLAGEFDAPLEVPTALLIHAAVDAVEDEIRAAQAAGWSDFKIKIGRGDQDSELAMVERCAELVGAEHLRLDCNRAWHLHKAKRFMTKLGIRPAFIEEPSNSPVYYNLLSRSQTIALDETLRDIDPTQLVKARRGVLVCKPTIIGSLEPFTEAGWPLLLSSALESPLGLSHLGHLQQRYASLPAGLDTLGVFSADVADAFSGELAVARGALRSAGRVVPSEELLEPL